MDIISVLDDPLEFERERVKHLQPTAAIAPLSPPPPTCSYDPTVSSIGRSEGAASYKPQRPQLEHPAMPSIRIFQKAETRATRQAQILDEQTQIDFTTIDRLNEEKEAAIHEFLEKEKARKTWGVLTTAVQYIATSASIFLGLLCIATGVGAGPGVLLVVSGVAGLFTRMAGDLGWFQKIAAWFSKSVEVQNKIASRIQMGAFFLSLASSLAGGFWAHGAGALGSAVTNRLGESIQIGTSLMGAGFRMKEGHVQSQIGAIQKKMKKLELEIDNRYWDIDQNSKDGKKMMETLNSIAQQLKHTLATCRHAAAQ